MKREFVIDGERFNDTESFYREIDKLFTKDLDWGPGRNLGTFNDILYGGFGVHKFKEPIKIIWKNFSKSRNDFGYEATIKHYEEGLAISCDPTRMTHIKNKDDLDNIINMVKKQLKDAQNGVGDTLIDIIVKTITDTRGEHDRTLEIIE